MNKASKKGGRCIIKQLLQNQPSTVCFPVVCPWNRQGAETLTWIYRTSVLWNSLLASSYPRIRLHPSVYNFPLLFTFLYLLSFFSAFVQQHVSPSSFHPPLSPHCFARWSCQYTETDFPEVITNFGKTTIQIRIGRKKCLWVDVRIKNSRTPHGVDFF